MKKGFTLIELLVSISIIALLASVIFSNLGSANQKGRDSRKINDLREVRSALQLYVTDRGSYPSNTSSLIDGSYIKSINPNIKYEGLYLDGSYCSAVPCQSYHLAIPLERTDNKVLTTDKDIDDIKKYPILCYLIYMITCKFSKYKIWNYEDT